jgi:hypothetical protein
MNRTALSSGVVRVPEKCELDRKLLERLRAVYPQFAHGLDAWKRRAPGAALPVPQEALDIAQRCAPRATCASELLRLIELDGLRVVAGEWPHELQGLHY